MSWAGLFGRVESGRHTTRECARPSGVSWEITIWGCRRPPSASAARRARCTDPAHGAPPSRAPGALLDFSLSRSGPHWLLAVTAGAKIGVDIEPLDSAVGVADVALTEDERARMRGLEAGDNSSWYLLTSLCMCWVLL